MPLLPEPEATQDAERRLLSHVHEHGLQVTHVFPEAGTPGWSYSIGIFRTHGQPEVVVFGLNQKVAHHVVNELGRRAAKSALEANQGHDDLLEGYRCLLKPVHERWYEYFFGFGLWYYRHQSFPALQLIWPDKQHLYPWDPSFHKPWRWAQPLLYESDPVAANAVELLRTMGSGAAG